MTTPATEPTGFAQSPVSSPAYLHGDIAAVQVRVLCTDRAPHYRWGQDVSTFRSLEVALEWADEFSSKPGVGQACGPHSIGEPA